MMYPSLCNFTLMDPLNTTDSSPCTCHLSSLACLTLVHSDRLPSCSLWRLHRSLTPDGNLSLALSRLIGIELHGEEFSSVMILRRDPSHRTFRTCANLKCTCTLPLFPFVQFKYGHTQTDRHTHMSCNAVTLVWGSLSLAPNILTNRLLIESRPCNGSKTA